MIVKHRDHSRTLSTVSRGNVHDGEADGAAHVHGARAYEGDQGERVRAAV